MIELVKKNGNVSIDTPTINIETISQDYQDMENKPQINGVELNGNKSLNDLGIQPEGDYALKSDIPTNGIPFKDEYINNANEWLTNGYIKTADGTINLPEEVEVKWGILFFIAENAKNGTGTQMYWPIDGEYKGRIFTRYSLVRNFGEWHELATKEEIENAILFTPQELTEEQKTQVRNNIGAKETENNFELLATITIDDSNISNKYEWNIPMCSDIIVTSYCEQKASTDIYADIYTSNSKTGKGLTLTNKFYVNWATKYSTRNVITTNNGFGNGYGFSSPYPGAGEVYPMGVPSDETFLDGFDKVTLVCYMQSFMPTTTFNVYGVKI